ncbi:MAG: hypothetical protein QNJ90_03230 [Planctomycetota bacterium]|nr:hypothetical protein [Planctomycetota bacterium]
MDAADPSDTEQAFAALLHRLASPLGAIANYAHLLPREHAREARAGILDALASLKGTLEDAQGWLDALETSREAVPQEGLDLAEVLRTVMPEAEVPALPLAAVPPAAAERLLRALVQGLGGSPLRLQRGAGAGVHLEMTAADRRWSEAEAERALALFPPRDSGSNGARGELAVAGALAGWLGGRAWGGVGPEGEVVLHVELPAVEERNDA